MTNDNPQLLLVRIPPINGWWVMIGVIGHNPGTWDFCPIVADDGSQRVVFTCVVEFQDWNMANRVNRLQVTPTKNSGLFILS